MFDETYFSPLFTFLIQGRSSAKVVGEGKGGPTSRKNVDHYGCPTEKTLNSE